MNPFLGVHNGHPAGLGLSFSDIWSNVQSLSNEAFKWYAATSAPEGSTTGTVLSVPPAPPVSPVYVSAPVAPVEEKKLPWGAIAVVGGVGLLLVLLFLRKR